MNRTLQIYFFSLLTLALGACSSTRHLEKDQSLLTRVKFKGVEESDLRSGLRDNLGYTTNRKILGIYPFYLQAWNLGKDGRDTNVVRRFLRDNVGEPPMVLDSANLESSVEQLELYLFNSGYFNAEVRYSVKKRRKRSKVTYHIDLHAPYRIADMEYRVYDRDLYRKVITDTAKSKIHVGEVFNTEDLSSERERITQSFRNDGYFFFSKEYIAFDVDSGNGNHSVDIALEMKNPTLYKRHQKYTFGEVYVDILYPWYLKGIDDSTFTETDGIHVRTRGMPIEKDLFPEYIPIRPGLVYSDQLVNNTYNRLYDLQIFGTVRLELVADTATRLVKVFVIMTPDKEIDIGIEPQFITSDQSSSVTANNSRIWGVSGQVYFKNKNLLRGAELFDITYSGAAEFQYADRTFAISNLQQSISTSLSIPKLVWINRFDKIQKRAKEKDWQRQTTNFSLTFSYQFNRDFLQRTSLLSWSYGWKTGYNFFRVVPIEINLNQVDLRSNFLDNLTPGNRVLLSSLLNPNFIPSNRVEWYYEDKGLSKSGNYHKFLFTIEQAGNLTYLGFRASGTPPPADDIYKVLGTNLFQYLKADFDLRYYSFPFPEVQVAYRIRTGWAQPLGNSRVIPFDKRFFIGGANSLRGWKPRSVGPGSYTSDGGNQIDRSGEVVIEGSAELRFRVVPGLIEGAVFLDGGNIWNVYKDSSLEGANITPLFINQFAFNTGLGIRYDASFVIIRLDYGMQLRDPGHALSGGWVLNDFAYLRRRTAFNFGIGYPF